MSSEPLYEDDPYGGWKAPRKTAATSRWSVLGSLRKLPGVVPEAFVVDRRPMAPPRGTALLLPGLPATSFSFREVVRALGEKGWRVASLDWPGFGLSEKPQPGSGFGYGVGEYGAVVAGLVKELELENGRFLLVSQGYLATQVAADYVTAAAAGTPAEMPRPSAWVALSPPWRAGKSGAPVPRSFAALSNPVLGPVLASDPTYLADNAFNSAGAFAVLESDLEVVRQPYMESGMAGFAARRAVREAVGECRSGRMMESAARAVADAGGAGVKLVVAQGLSDRWVGEEGVREWVTGADPKVALESWPQSGHFPQEDCPERVVQLLEKYADP